jgi:hypothetical protein
VAVDEDRRVAEAHEVNVAPHNFYGHLCTMMNAHFAAACRTCASWRSISTACLGRRTVHRRAEDRERAAGDARHARLGHRPNEEALKAHPPKATRAARLREEGLVARMERSAIPGASRERRISGHQHLPNRPCRCLFEAEDAARIMPAISTPTGARARGRRTTLQWIYVPVRSRRWAAIVAPQASALVLSVDGTMQRSTLVEFLFCEFLAVRIWNVPLRGKIRLVCR